MNIQSCFTTGINDATQKANRAIKEGSTGLIIVGGDGTLNEVVNGCFENGKPLNKDLTLAIVPAGTGSDFIKTPQIPTDNIQAINCLLQGKSIPLDIGQITCHEEKRYFINIADAGIGGAICADVNQGSKVMGGFITFLSATLKTFWTYQNKQSRILVDDKIEFNMKASNIIIANGQYFGGGMQIAPSADISDGLFEIIILGDFSRFEAYSNIVQVYKGTHLSHPKVEYLRGTKVHIESGETQLLDVDGESWGQTPATFEVLPQCFNLLVPAYS